MIHNHKGSMNIGTFGNTPAAITLAKILAKDEYKKYVGRVSRLLQQFGAMLNQLSGTDTKVSVGMEHIIFKHYLNGCESLPTEVKTFTQNLIAMKHRIWNESNDAYRPRKTRIKRENSSE